MPAITACPNCQRQLKVPENLLGKTVRCPSCKQTFVAQGKQDDAIAMIDEEPRPPASGPGTSGAQTGAPISGVGSAPGLSGELGADRFAAAGFASIAQPSFAGAGTAGAESVQPAFSHNDLLTSPTQGDRWRTASSTSQVQRPSHASDGSDPFADPTGADNWWWV